jgi:hypothetical protein
MFIIEVHDVTFITTSQASITFNNVYGTIPIVTATVKDSNINVSIENLTTTGATVRVSDDNFSGSVHVQVIGN